MSKSRKKSHPLVVLFFILYILLLFYLLFFSESYGRTIEERNYRYNLELFKEIKRFWNYRESLGWKTVILNLVGNIVAFVPFGFFLPMFFKFGRNFLGCVFASSFFSFFVESVQLATKVGAFDVDDIFLNTLGGLIGFFLYLFMNKRVILVKKENIRTRK